MKFKIGKLKNSNVMFAVPATKKLARIYEELATVEADSLILAVTEWKNKTESKFTIRHICEKMITFIVDNGKFCDII